VSPTELAKWIEVKRNVIRHQSNWRKTLRGQHEILDRISRANAGLSKQITEMQKKLDKLCYDSNE
jgi:hypothetical protein